MRYRRTRYQYMPGAPSKKAPEPLTVSGLKPDSLRVPQGRSRLIKRGRLMRLTFLRSLRPSGKALKALTPVRPWNRPLDEHRFRSLGKLVVGNLDRIADVDNVGN